MLTLEPEISDLRDQGHLPEAVAGRLLAIERRAPMSVHDELRVALWLAVTLITTGLGLFLKKNIDQIGHLTLILVIAVASAACYAITWMRRRAGKASAADDYLLLLGALLLSADVAYFETQYRTLGENWRHYLLIMAGIHGATAYLYDSRVVLSLALTSLAGWMGIDSRGEFTSQDSWQIGARLLATAALALLWRFLNDRYEKWRHFDEVFDNVVIHLAMIAALVWIFEGSLEAAGLALLAGLVAAAIWLGIRGRREAFIIYAVIYGVIGINAALLPDLDEGEALGFVLLTTPLVIVALFYIHRRWRTHW